MDKQVVIQRAVDFLTSNLSKFEVSEASESKTPLGVERSITKFAYKSANGEDRKGQILLQFDPEAPTQNSFIDILFGDGAYTNPRERTLRRNNIGNCSYKKPQLQRLESILMVVEGSFARLDQEKQNTAAQEENKKQLAKAGFSFGDENKCSLRVLDQGATASIVNNKLTISIDGLDVKSIEKVLSALTEL